MKIMFDTNAFDKIQKNISYIRKNKYKYDFYITSIQIKEILKIPESKSEIRENIITNVIELRPTLVPVPFSWDFIDFSHFSFKVEPEYWTLLKSTKTNRNDALIAATAIKEGCTLVTDDKELLNKMRKINKPVITFDEFVFASQSELQGC